MIYDKLSMNMSFAYYPLLLLQDHFQERDYVWFFKRVSSQPFLQELAAMLKAFAMLAALLANTVFASSLAEPSARCEVIEVALLSNHDSILRIAVLKSAF